MNTAYPAAWSSHTFFKFTYCSMNVFLSCLIFLDKSNPANPLIARKWCQFVPFLTRTLIRSKRLSQIRRKFVHRTYCIFFVVIESLRFSRELMPSNPIYHFPILNHSLLIHFLSIASSKSIPKRCAFTMAIPTMPASSFASSFFEMS